MARSDARSSSLRRRPSRTIPATLTAIGVTAVGVALAWAAVSRLVSGRWPGWVGSIHAWAAGQSWGSAVVIVIAVVVLVLGLVLLVAALSPGQPTAYRLEPATPAGAGADGAPEPESTEFVMTRRAVATLAGARAYLVDGVESVDTAVTGRAVTLTVGTVSTQHDDIAGAVTTAVRDTLGAAGLSPMPTVSTNVRIRQP